MNTLIFLNFLLFLSCQNVAANNSTGLLKQLRALFKNTEYVPEPLQAYIVLSEDAHQNEYLAARDARRAFLSGFTGSSGALIITEKQACLWTDSRYFLQAAKQLDENWTLMKQGIPSTPTQGDWLGKTLPSGSKIGFDPAIMTYSMWKMLQAKLQEYGQTLVPVNNNLVDLIWNERPSPPSNVVVPLELNYTGATSSSKIEKVRVKMQEKKTAFMLVIALDEIAWLLNLRGSDIPYNPVFFAYVLITPTEVHMFVDRKKITSAVVKHLRNENLVIKFHLYEKVQSVLSKLVASEVSNEKKVWMTPGASYAFAKMVPEKLMVLAPSPIIAMRAIKNEVEAKGLINAYIKDAAAVCSFFAWMENVLAEDDLDLTEISVTKQLEKFRMKQKDYVGPSFETISASGPHGAIIHYKPQPKTDRVITKDEMYLCDSGGQYKDGTTDVSRTMHFGTPSDYEKECFTRVVKGLIHLRTALFPNTENVYNMLNILARKYLWDVGLTYSHGTAHGIGVYLNVHEALWFPLQENMFLSNEPGYYEEGHFGVRVENIMRIVKGEPKYARNNTKFLAFDDVTLVPIQSKLLVPSLLTKKEVTYLNDYHRKCREKVGPLLKEQGEENGFAWLMRETEPLSLTENKHKIGFEVNLLLQPELEVTL